VDRSSGAPVGISLLAVKPQMIGGLATYVREVSRALALRSTSKYVFFSTERLHDEWRRHLPPGAEIRSVDIGNESATRRALFEIVRLPVLARKSGCGVLFYPNTSAPVQTAPVPVVALFDVMYRSQPNDTPFHKRLYLDLCCWRLRESRTPVVTLSEFSRRDIHERTGIPLERITAVPCGVDDQFFEACHESGRTRNGTSDAPYILSVGAAYPHKRLPVIIDAFDRISKEHPDLGLVMVGVSHGSQGERSKVLARIQASPSRSQIKVLDSLPWEDLPDLYRTARALVHASQFEGFGLPIAEAMAVCTPVAASPAGGVLELLNGYGETAGGWNGDQLAAALSRVLGWTDEQKRSKTTDARERIRRHYRWPLVAEQLEAQFASALASYAS